MLPTGKIGLVIRTFSSTPPRHALRWGRAARALLCAGGLACVLLSAGCSTKRNTAATRAYHELTTRYNIHFNAEEAYQEILNEKAGDLQENYVELMPFYPPLSDAEKSSPGGPFDPVIEKTGKAILEHSITAKPRRDPAKARSQEYRQWLLQEEFNPFLKDVWMLRGKAFLQNGDYDEALAVFSGMLRRYAHDRAVADETEIWMLRAYTEMERMYEAEKTAYSLMNKKLPDHLEKLFTEHYTYFLIRKREFTEAVTPLRKTIMRETDHLRKKKLQFLLAQIHAIAGEKEQACLAFEEVKGFRTPPVLARNASRWQSAIVNDTLALLLHPAKPDTGIVTAAIDTTGLTAGKVMYNQNTRGRLAERRSLAENAALHRQWRSRNGLGQSVPTVHAGGMPVQDAPFSAGKEGPHSFLLAFAPGTIDKNQLLFTVAGFNFTHFKLRRFNVSYIALAGMEALRVEPFRSFDETSRYAGMMRSDSLTRATLPAGVTPVVISAVNAELLLSGKTMDEYHAFYQANMPTGGIDYQAMVKEVAAEFEGKKEEETEKIVPLETLPPTLTGQAATPARPAGTGQEGQSDVPPPVQEEPGGRETPEALKKRLERNAAEALRQQQETAPATNRGQLLKERERQRQAKIRQKERDLKERQRQREAALKQREKERAKKVRKQ